MRNEPVRRRWQRAARLSTAAALMTASLCLSERAAFAQDSASPVTLNAVQTEAASAVEFPLHAAVLREGARFAQRLASSPEATATRQRPWIARHPVIAGALIGTAGGAVLAQTRTVGGVNHDPRVALLGTAIGAWSGVVASAVSKARAHEPVSIGTKIAIAAGAVSLVVLPLVASYAAGG